MSINIGDNFSYLGKKFLDSRESFNTLEDMNSCIDIPIGFITYCVEDKKRYEYTENGWVEYIAKSNFDDIDLSNYATSVFSSEIPEDDEAIWFSKGTSSTSSDITYDNPLINELFSCIQTLQKQVMELQKDVEYLKIYGGGGGSNDDDDDDDNGNNDNNNNGYTFLLEDGGSLMLEDGAYLLLENAVTNLSSSVLLLEDGARLLLENGNNINLE